MCTVSVDYLVRPLEVFDEVARFIGLPEAQPTDDLSKGVFTGSQSEMPDALRKRLLKQLAPQYEYLETLFPDLVPQWLARHRS